MEDMLLSHERHLDHLCHLRELVSGHTDFRYRNSYGNNLPSLKYLQEVYPVLLPR